VNVGKLGSNFVDARRIDAKTLLCRQGLAGDLQQDAFENGCRHDGCRH